MIEQSEDAIVKTFEVLSKNMLENDHRLLELIDVLILKINGLEDRLDKVEMRATELELNK